MDPAKTTRESTRMFIGFFGLIACDEQPTGKGGEDTAVDTARSDSAVTTAGCPDGWSVEAPESAVHVRADGDDAGTGGESDPVLTLERAVELTRAAGTVQTILLGEGSFEARLRLEADAEEGSDDGLTLAGCGDSTVLVPLDEGEPTLLVSEVAVSLAGLRFEGGRPAIWAWQAATVDVAAISIAYSERLGFLGDGSDTLLRGDTLTIEDTVAEATSVGDVGYGLQVSSATVELVNLSITGSTGVGALFDAADVTLEEVWVSGTSSTSDGTFGRGIQLQSDASAVISGGTLSGNADAGLFALLAPSLVITGLTIDGTVAADLGGGESSGDGIVVTQGSYGLDPTWFSATVTGCTVTGSARAGMLFADVTAEVSGNTVSDAGYTVDGGSILAQGTATVTGTDTVATLSTALPVADGLLSVDQP